MLKKSGGVNTSEGSVCIIMYHDRILFIIFPVAWTTESTLRSFTRNTFTQYHTEGERSRYLQNKQVASTGVQPIISTEGLILCLPGVKGVSPVSTSLRVKSVGRYLGFCQIQKRFRFTTSERGTSLSESIRLDTGTKLPSSISSTKFLVAVENIFNGRQRLSRMMSLLATDNKHDKNTRLIIR